MKLAGRRWTRSSPTSAATRRRRRSVADPALTCRATSSRSRSRRRWTRCSATSARHPRERDAARDVLRQHQAGHDPRLLHLGDRHPQGAALQGQPDAGRVRGLPDRGRQGLPALRAEGGGLTWPRTRPSTSTSPPSLDESRKPGRVHQARLRPLGRDRGGQRRRRRHGRLPARHRRHQGADAGSRPHARPPQGVPDDGVAVRLAAPAAACPPTSARSRSPSTTSSTGPTATTRRSRKYKKLASYAGNTFTRNWVVNEKEHPTTGTPYSWVRARVLGGKTNFWGRVAIRYGPLQFQAASRDGFDVDWPIGYEDVAPYYDKVDVLLGVLGHQGRPRSRCRTGSTSAPIKMNCVEIALQERRREDGPALHPRPRRRHHRRRPEQQVPRALPGPRALQRAAATSTPPSTRRPRSSSRRATPATSPSGPTRSCSEVFLDPETGTRGRRARHRREHERGDGLQGEGGRARRGHASTARASCSTRSRRSIRTGWATRRASSAAT